MSHRHAEPQLYTSRPCLGEIPVRPIKRADKNFQSALPRDLEAVATRVMSLLAAPCRRGPFVVAARDRAGRRTSCRRTFVAFYSCLMSMLVSKVPRHITSPKAYMWRATGRSISRPPYSPGDTEGGVSTYMTCRKKRVAGRYREKKTMRW